MGNKCVSNPRKVKISRKKNDIENIRSKYILQQICLLLNKKKLLKIIHYNKIAKKRLNINIKNYKELSEIYTSIYLEIIPKQKECGKFINIRPEEKSHIYFNNNKEEEEENIYRIEKNNNISNIKIKIDYQIMSFSKLFYKCKCIQSIYFKKFYRNNINDMFRMFSGCSSLKEIVLSNFNTTNVNDMSCMFSRCLSLKEIDLSNFNTNKVIILYVNTIIS